MKMVGDGARTNLAGIDSVSQKERNSAVFSGATAPEEAKKIVVDTQGRPIEEEENLVSTDDRLDYEYRRYRCITSRRVKQSN